MNRFQAFFYNRARSSKKAKTTFSTLWSKDSKLSPQESSWDSIWPGFIFMPLFTGVLTTVLLGVYEFVTYLAWGSENGVSALPALSSSGFCAILLAGLLFGFLVLAPMMAKSELKALTLPSIAEREVFKATIVITKIKEQADNPVIANDPEAFLLAKGACKLYDDCLLSLSELARRDQRSFENFFAQEELKDSNSPKVMVLKDPRDREFSAWIKEAMGALDTLTRINEDLETLILTHDQAQELQLRAQAVLGAQKSSTVKAVSSTQKSLEESLDELKLREEIKKKSSLEIEEFLSAQ